MKVFKGKKGNQTIMFKMNDDLKKENIQLKVKLNLLKKYISQSSFVNKTIQTELFERTEELENEKNSKQLEDDGEII